MGLSLVAVLVVGLAAYLATRSEDPSSARRQALHAQPAEAQAGLARSAFIQKAGAICIDEEARQQRLLQRAAPATLAEFAAYFDRSMPGYRKMMDALEALKPPPGDRKLVKAFFGEARRAIDSMAMMRRAAGAGDEEAFAVALNDTQRITQQANALATSYGLDSCAGID